MQAGPVTSADDGMLAGEATGKQQACLKHQIWQDQIIWLKNGRRFFFSVFLAVLTWRLQSNYPALHWICCRHGTSSSATMVKLRSWCCIPAFFLDGRRSFDDGVIGCVLPEGFQKGTLANQQLATYLLAGQPANTPDNKPILTGQPTGQRMLMLSWALMPAAS